MRRIIVKEARPGMIAARSLPHPEQPGTAIVAGDETITIRHILKFHELGVYDLWVNDPGLEFLDDLCCSQPTRSQQNLAEALRESFLGWAAHVPAAFTRRHAIQIQELAEGILRTAPVIPCLRAFADDQALLAHSCDVAVLACYLGIGLENHLIEQRRRLNCRQARDLLNLAVGALFHDVGELMLPPGQRESRLAASACAGAVDADADAWKQHTAEGFAIVRGRLDPSASVILAQHHQHFDGSGFAAAPGEESSLPGGVAGALSGQAIHVHARIVMASDVFCQFLFGDPSSGPGRVPQPMVRALWQIQQPAVRKWFDPAVHQAITGLLWPFVEGMAVTMQNHRQAVVVKIPEAGSCFPEVESIGGRGGSARGPFEDTDVQLDVHTGGDQERRKENAVLAVDGSKVDGYLYGVRQDQPLAAA